MFLRTMALSTMLTTLSFATAPSVSAVTCSPTGSPTGAVGTGQQITISATVNEGSEKTHRYWSAKNSSNVKGQGTFAKDTLNSVKWTAPTTVGTYTLGVQALNSSGTNSQTIPLNVIVKHIILANNTRTWKDGTYATSCLKYLDSGSPSYPYIGDTGDGVYKIDIDGAGSSLPFDVYCDMTTDSGGWTLIAKAQQSSNAHADINAVGTLASPTQATVAKLSDATINSMTKSYYRMQNSIGTKKVYFDTSDSFASTRVSYNKASKTINPPVWEGSFTNTAHRGLSTHTNSGGSFARGDVIAFVYTGTSSTDTCRMAMYATDGLGTWCGSGDAGTVWLK